MPSPKTKRVKLLKFTSKGCQPCKAMLPILAKFKKAHPEVEIIEIDVNGDRVEENLVAKYDVTCVPTFIFINSKGKRLWSIEGVCSLLNLESSLNGSLKLG